MFRPIWPCLAAITLSGCASNPDAGGVNAAIGAHLADMPSGWEACVLMRRHDQALLGTKSGWLSEPKRRLARRAVTVLRSSEHLMPSPLRSPYGCGQGWSSWVEGEGEMNELEPDSWRSQWLWFGTALLAMLWRSRLGFQFRADLDRHH